MKYLMLTLALFAINVDNAGKPNTPKQECKTFECTVKRTV